MTTFPPELRTERKALGVSVADMARRLGHTPGYLSRIERGDRSQGRNGKLYPTLTPAGLVERYREILRREKAAG